VQAPDDSGVSQRWAIEWSGTSQLANNGITRDTLHVATPWSSSAGRRAWPVSTAC